MKKLSIILFICACLIAGTASATDYYVSTAGIDTNPGTLALPWRTIQHAANVVKAGSTVYIRGGIYNEKVNMNVTGSASKGYISFINYPNETPIVDGTGISNPEIFELYGVNYIKIIGLTLRNSIGNNRVGILIEYGSTHIEIRKNEIYNIFFDANPNAVVNTNKNCNPLLVYGDHPTKACSAIVIDSNIIHDCRTGFSEALSLDGNVTGFSITNNTVYNNTNIGILMAGHYQACPTPNLDQARNGVCSNNHIYNCGSAYAEAAGIYVDGAKLITIEKNRVHNCQYGLEVGCEEGFNASGNNVNVATKITVRDNLFYRNASAGIAFGGYDYPASAGRVTNCTFYNNTLIENDTMLMDGLAGEIVITASSACKVKNNIIKAGGDWLVSKDNKTTPGLVIDYNIWYTPGGSHTAKFNWTLGNNVHEYDSFAQYRTATGMDAHSLFADPMLAGPYDHHLTAASPAINSGDPAYTPPVGETDFGGAPRLHGAHVDMGADEFPGAGNPNPRLATPEPISQTGTVSIYPNPASSAFTVALKDFGDEPMLLEVFDLQGKRTFQRQITGNGLTDVQTTDWEKGIYIIRLTGPNTSTSGRIIIQ
jgi:hypothetical protein